MDTLPPPVNAPMDAFSYLSVLLSIILGLSLTQILKGFRGLMLARKHVRSYWPTVLWAVLLMIIDVQAWWAMYELRLYRDWTFLAFAVVLAQTVPLYLLAGLVLPDIRTEPGLDLRAHYYDNHRWFFSLAALLCVISISKVLVLFGEWPPPLDLGFQAVFITSSVIGAYTARERYHKVMAPVAMIGICAYIGVLFTHLR